MAHYYCYWGKAEKEGSQYRLLPYHCLDVAAVTAAWWDSSPAIRRAFRQETSFLFVVLAIPAAIWAISSPFIGGLALLACLFTVGQALGIST